MLCNRYDALLDISGLPEIEMLPVLLKQIKNSCDSISTLYINIPHYLVRLDANRVYCKGKNPFDTIMWCVQYIYDHAERVCADMRMETFVAIPGGSYENANLMHIFRPNNAHVICDAFPNAQVHSIKLVNETMQKKNRNDTCCTEQRYCDDLSEIYSELKTFEFGCVGGTFDHFHVGHKILLTASMAVVTNKLVIGVADGPLLANKSYRQFIQDCHVRKQKLLEFCKKFLRPVQIEICIIEDPCGPAAVDKDLQVCIVSEESIKGLDALNATRIVNGLEKLDSRVVKLFVAPTYVVEDDGEDVHQIVKASSTQYRRREALQSTTAQPQSD